MKRVSSTSRGEGNPANKKTKVLTEPSAPESEILPDLYKPKRNLNLQASSPNENLIGFPKVTETEAALNLIKESFPEGILQDRLPPVVLYWQLFSLIKNKFLMDTQLSTLAKENKILTFSHLNSGNYLIVFTSDYLKIKREELFKRFVDKDLIEKHKFKENQLRLLVNNGYLAIKEAGYYQAGLPFAGDFLRMYSKGRKFVIQSIRKAKFSQILQSELEKRSLKTAVPLGVKYHIYDLIGSKDILTSETTSGTLLRVPREGT